MTRNVRKIKTVTDDDVFVVYRRSKPTKGSPTIETYTTNLTFVPTDFPGKAYADIDDDVAPVDRQLHRSNSLVYRRMK